VADSEPLNESGARRIFIAHEHARVWWHSVSVWNPNKHKLLRTSWLPAT